jgi:hypothetical protein
MAISQGNSPPRRKGGMLICECRFDAVDFISALPDGLHRRFTRAASKATAASSTGYSGPGGGELPPTSTGTVPK